MQKLSLGIGGLLPMARCATGDYGRGWSLCGRSSNLRVVDLDISPDPVTECQQVRSWRVDLRADVDRECATTVQIQERPGNITVGTKRVYYLRLGTNTITVQPDSRYRFSQARHCFTVITDIDETPRAIDASGNFCAQKQGNGWTMAGRCVTDRCRGGRLAFAMA